MAPKVAKEPKVGKKPAPKKVAGEKKGKEDGGAEKAPIAAVQKARKVQKKVVKGVHGTRVKKVGPGTIIHLYHTPCSRYNEICRSLMAVYFSASAK